MNNASRTNTAREKLRINTDIRTRIHYDSTCDQSLSQQSPLRAINTGFVSCVKRPVDWKGVLVNPVSNSAKKGNYPLSIRVGITVKRRAKGQGSKNSAHPLVGPSPQEPGINRLLGAGTGNSNSQDRK